MKIIDSVKMVLGVCGHRKQLTQNEGEEYTRKIEANKIKIEIENLEEIADMKVFVNGEEITDIVKIDLQSEYASGRTFRSLVVDRYEGFTRERIKIRI